MLAQLIAQYKRQPTQQTTHRQLVESFRQKILEKTGDGDLIIGFLISAMKGEFDDFRACHRLEAVRLLEKFTGVKAKAFIDNLDPQPPTRRERRDTRRADRRISTEIAQLAQEKTDGGDLIIDFLIQAMQGELADFKPNHRMSASKELLRCVFDFTEEEEEEAEPVETPEEREERLRREDYDRRRAEAVEFSLHGPVYYETYPDAWCICENRRYDCDGNELSGEALEKRLALAPGWDTFIHDRERQADYKRRYKAYLERINPGVEIDINQFRWRTIPDAPYP